MKIQNKDTWDRLSFDTMRRKYFCDVFKWNSHCGNLILYLQQKLPHTLKHSGCIFSMLIIPTKIDISLIADCEYANVTLPEMAFSSIGSFAVPTNAPSNHDGCAERASCFPQHQEQSDNLIIFLYVFQHQVFKISFVKESLAPVAVLSFSDVVQHL